MISWHTSDGHGPHPGNLKPFDITTYQSAETPISGCHLTGDGYRRSSFRYVHAHSNSLFIQAPHAPLLTRCFHCKASTSISSFFNVLHRHRNQSKSNTSSPSNPVPLLHTYYFSFTHFIKHLREERNFVLRNPT